ncbi:MAG: glycosyltransferase [Anaerolineae bacterium]|nr:glycosyltransferase [Anaerolineae bacterium]
MRVCYFGTYRAEYSRNRIMIEGLRRNGIDVVECHESLWTGIEDRVAAASGGWLRPGFWVRVVRTYTRLLRKYFQIGTYDILIVGYPGQFDVFLARLLSWWRRRPLVWDIFMSIYLIALERGLDVHSRFTLDLIRCVERMACRLPDLLILDTDEYVAWFGRVHGVPAERFRLVPTGADDRIFHPVSCPGREDNIFRVVYYGTFIPNHGVEHIVEAARLLAEEPNIRFELIGQGPDLPKAQEMAQKYGLKNIEFVPWLDQVALVQRVACADVCLGAFGTTPQSLMTVQNKIYEGMAMGKPVITGDSRAVSRTLVPDEEICLCARANGVSLAQAIRRLRDDPTLRRRIAYYGYYRFKREFDMKGIGRQYVAHLSALTSQLPSSGTF